MAARAAGTMDKMHESGLTPIPLPTGDVGYEEASLTIVCRVAYEQNMTQASFLDKSVMPRWYPKGPSDLHTMYIGQIIAAYHKPKALF